MPLKSLLLTERKHKKETGGFPRLEHISLSPKPCWPNSSISRYRVHKHPCSFKEQVIVQRFQGVMLAGSWWENSGELIFQVRILSLPGSFVPTSVLGVGNPSPNQSQSNMLLRKRASWGLRLHISSVKQPHRLSQYLSNTLPLLPLGVSPWQPSWWSRMEYGHQGLWSNELILERERKDNIKGGKIQQQTSRFIFRPRH